MRSCENMLQCEELKVRFFKLAKKKINVYYVSVDYNKVVTLNDTITRHFQTILVENPKANVESFPIHNQLNALSADLQPFRIC